MRGCMKRQNYALSAGDICQGLVQAKLPTDTFPVCKAIQENSIHVLNVISGSGGLSLCLR